MRTLKRAKLPIEVLLYNAHHIKQVALVKLSERLKVTGKIVVVYKEPRGYAISAKCKFALGGAAAVTLTSVFLRPNPASTARRVTTGPEDDQAEHAPADFMLTMRKLITPDRVIVFSKDAGNKIHTDPGFAARFGYRAPVADGPMLVSYILEAVDAKDILDQPEAEAKFVSSIFWDDGLDIMVRTGSAGETDHTFAIRCINPRGDLTCEANIQI